MKVLYRFGPRLTLEYKKEDQWIGRFYTDDDLWVCIIPCLPLHWRRKL